MFQEFWQRDVEESVRQRNAIPFMEEAILQVSSWGFSLADLKLRKKLKRKGILHWLKMKYGQAEDELTGFVGPMHIWQVGEAFVSCFLSKFDYNACTFATMISPYFFFFYSVIFTFMKLHFLFFACGGCSFSFTIV